jgi:hypothetical protein
MMIAALLYTPPPRPAVMLQEIAGPGTAPSRAGEDDCDPSLHTRAAQGPATAPASSADLDHPETTDAPSGPLAAI